MRDESANPLSRAQGVKPAAQFILFQVGWFACVIGGDVVALVVTAMALMLHQWLFVRDMREWLLIALVSALGLLVDSGLALSGVLEFPTRGLLSVPLWLLCLWCLFATTLSHSLAWLQSDYRVAALLAAIAGPLSYWTGAQLSGVQLAAPVYVSLLLLSATWAAVLPLCLQVRRILFEQ